MRTTISLGVLILVVCNGCSAIEATAQRWGWLPPIDATHPAPDPDRPVITSSGGQRQQQSMNLPPDPAMSQVPAGGVQPLTWYTNTAYDPAAWAQIRANQHAAEQLVGAQRAAEAAANGNTGVLVNPNDPTIRAIVGQVREDHDELNRLRRRQ